MVNKIIKRKKKDYSTAKIYKLTSINTIMIYTGSTIQELIKRFYNHIHNNPYMDYGDVSIELIEEFPCNNLEELLIRERYYFELYKHISVNKNYPIRSSKERYQHNRIDIIDKQKQYNYKNKDKIAIYQKDKYNTDKIKRLEYQKQYNIVNKEKIKQYKKDRIERKQFVNKMMNIVI